MFAVGMLFMVDMGVPFYQIVHVSGELRIMGNDPTFRSVEQVAVQRMRLIPVRSGSACAMCREAHDESRQIRFLACTRSE